jgi:hypothetical protein
MRIKLLLVVAVVGLVSTGALAQEPPEPPALELPLGARVRVRTSASSDWIKGTLASADTATIGLVPEEAPPLGDNQLRLPSAGVTELQLVTGEKSRWLYGLVIGAGLGVAMGFDTDVDSAQCEVSSDVFCSRAGAMAAMGITSAALGALIGKLIKTDVWTPVALDALGPPRESGTRASIGLQPVPGGLGATVSVRF